MDYVKEWKLSSLTAIFGSSEEDSPDNEKLLHLYWNRNALKKEFAGLRNEQFRLKEKIRQQEGVSAGLQQKLDHMENLLLDPEWSRSVAVFYQLRAVALQCEGKLARFAERIKQQHERKQNDKLLASWNEIRAKDSAPLKMEILERRDAIQCLEDQSQSDRRQLRELNGLFRFFKRRSLRSNIAERADRIQVAKLEEAALKAQLDDVKSRTPPDTMGLDTRAKRSVNFMILAYTQHLYLQIGDRTLVGLVKESRDKSVGSVNYGSEKECAELLKLVPGCIAAIDGESNFAEALQKRAKLISEKAQFYKEDDAVPVPGTVSTLLEIDADGQVHESDVNLLGDNYWRIAATLSR
ncbi:MAG: hypothetical protein GXP15_02835 [Gammaproteobacteria bacterium]|nr:hypothetical protein [Gammaproteobacteria bacterium]